MFKKLAVCTMGIILVISMLAACEPPPGYVPNPDSLTETPVVTLNPSSEPEAEPTTMDKTPTLGTPGDFNIWNGTYESGKISLRLYRTGLDEIDLLILKDTSVSSVSASVESKLLSITLDSTEKLSYEDEHFGEEISLIIYKANEGIKLQVSSSNNESFLNGIDGSYAKKEFSNSGWDGVYEDGDISIILAEYESGGLYITIISGFQLYATYFSDYSNKEITYESEFGETDNISIIKTEHGIEIQSSSSDNGSLLNKISGVYTKAN